MSSNTDPTKQGLKALREDVSKKIEKLEMVRKNLDQALAALGDEGNAQLHCFGLPMEPNSGISHMTDKYIETLRSGQKFAMADAMASVGGIYNIDANTLRSRISSVLSRRVKSGVLERAERRGIFIKNGGEDNNSFE